MAPFRVSEAEAVRDVAALLTRVRCGEEIVIESSGSPIAMMLPLCSHHGRTLSESIAMAEAYEKEIGHVPIMDSDFAADMEEIIRGRMPRASAWDER